MEPPIVFTDQLDYQLPPELIAQQPLPQRDGSRLLVVDRADGSFCDERFSALPSLLNPDDLLVLNNTKVLPARFVAHRLTGSKISGLFLRGLGDGRWEVMLNRSAKLKVGERLVFFPPAHGDRIELRSYDGGGRWTVDLLSDATTQAVLERVGHTPLPPYIHRRDDNASCDAADRDRYQTVFAEAPGAVAAPTASLHFTAATLATLEARGVQRAWVTLHVGAGTFAPVTVERLDDHEMHHEYYDMPIETVERMTRCRSRGGRIVAAGTTTVRVIESCATAGDCRAATGRTDLFIRPPYSFRLVDVLLTNFHLPRSTLLALVMAFAGTDLVRAAYDHAIRERYRFFSYGDAMLIV